MAERAPDDLPRRRRTDAPADAGTPESSQPPETAAGGDAQTVEVPAGSQVHVDERTGDVNVTLPPPPPRGLGRRTVDTIGRLILNLTVVILGLVAVGLFVLWFLTNTDPGREKVRRIAIDQFNAHTNGRLQIGRVTGNLLEGFTFHAFAITEKNGAPFIAADSVRARYAFRGLLRKRIELDDVIIWTTRRTGSGTSSGSSPSTGRSRRTIACPASATGSPRPTCASSTATSS